MSIHELLKDALKTALTNAEKLDQTGTKWVSFGGKALVKNFPELGLFSDEPFFMLLADLCKTEVWAIEVNKNSIVEVEGLANLKLKIDLAFFEDIAVYCDYIRLEDQLDQKWQTYNLEHRLLYSGFRWKKWGDTQARAAANIKQARKMLVSGVFSLRQLSAILVYDDKQLQEQDLEQLLSLYPECETNVRVRRVILNFHCNQMPSCCLIVENMDTYHYLRPLVPNDWMLVCGEKMCW